MPVQRLVFDCLAYLIEHRFRAVGRDELVAAVWGRVDVAEARINELVQRVRRIIGDDGQGQRAIRTLPGFGYRWVLPIEAELAPEAMVAAAEPVSEVVHEPVPVTTGARGRRFVSAAIVLLVVTLLIFAGLYRAGRIDRSAPIRTVMVLPVSVDAGRESAWMRLGAMDLIADRLRTAGLPVLSSEDVLMALRGLDESGAAIDFDRLDRRLEIGTLVRGNAVNTPSGWTITLESHAADGRRRQVEATQVDAIAAAREAADRLLIALGHALPVDAAQTLDKTFEERLQQAQAAVLAGELDRVASIIAELTDFQREDPHVRFLLARVDLLSGRLEQARAGYDALLTTANFAGDPTLYGRVLTGRGAVRFRGRDFAGAEEDFDAAVQALQGQNAARDLGHALSGRAGARIPLNRQDAATADLGQAWIQLQQAGDHPGLAQVNAYFGLLESERGRYDLALPYLVRAADTFEAFGIAERTLTTLLALLDAHTQLLHWADALATSDRQWLLREGAGDPALAVVIAARRGRVLLALGRHREAASLLAETETRHVDVRANAVRYLHDFQADVAWQLGRHAAAAEAAERALATWPPNPAYDRRAHLVLLRQRALIAAGRATPALVEPFHSADGEKVSSAIEIARAEWAAHVGDGAAARAHFEAALATAQAQGAPAAIAQTAVAYAGWLLAGDHLDEASALAGRVGPWAVEDFDCALLQVAVLHRHGRREPWAAALRQAQSLAGERVIPEALQTPPMP